MELSSLPPDLVFHCAGLVIGIFGFVWPRKLLRLMTYFRRREFSEKHIETMRLLCTGLVIASIVFMVDDLAR